MHTALLALQPDNPDWTDGILKKGKLKKNFNDTESLEKGDRCLVSLYRQHILNL